MQLKYDNSSFCSVRCRVLLIYFKSPLFFKCDVTYIHEQCFFDIFVLSFLFLFMYNFYFEYTDVRINQSNVSLKKRIFRGQHIFALILIWNLIIYKFFTRIYFPLENYITLCVENRMKKKKTVFVIYMRVFEYIR